MKGRCYYLFELCTIAFLKKYIFIKKIRIKVALLYLSKVGYNAFCILNAYTSLVDEDWWMKNSSRVFND